MTPRARATNANALTSTTNAKAESRDRNGNGHVSQTKGGSRINLLLEKRAQSKERARRTACNPEDTRSKDAIETATGGNSIVAEGRKLASKVGPKPATAAPGKTRTKSRVVNEDIPKEEQSTKPKGSRTKSRKRDRPSPRDEGSRQKAAAPLSPRRSPRYSNKLADGPSLQF